MIIELPFPSSELHSHNKGHWRDKHDARKSAREIACGIGLEMLGRKPKCKSAMTIGYYFFLPKDIVRDEANLIHSMKASIDGLVDSGLIYKDEWKHLHMVEIKCEVDRENPRVELKLERA